MKSLISKITLVLITAIFTLFFSCKKESSDIALNTNTASSGSLIYSSVGGTVLDQSGDPIANAVVSINNKTVETNELGIFLFENIRMDSKRTYIKVNKTGYFLGSRNFIPVKNSVSFVTIKMLDNSTSSSFPSTTGGKITIDGVSLDFPTNSIKLETGGVYNGSVNVALKFIDPAGADLFEIMPGDLSAINSQGEERFLETYGMAAIELTSPAGQKLNVAEGKTVELSIPLSGTHLSNAPSSIPLWYFDETKGMWKEEGSASKIGNAYVGQVSHFSFWNADQPSDGTTINGKVVCGTNPIQNAKVIILDEQGRRMGTTFTNNKGEYSGMIAQNRNLTIEVEEPLSGSLVHSSSIGSFTSAANIPDLDICSSGNIYGMLKVNLNDCIGNSIKNGVLVVKAGVKSVIFFPNSTGKVNAAIFVGSYSSIDITGYDLLKHRQSAETNILVSSLMDYGNLKVCSPVDEYVFYKIDGKYYNYYKIATTLVRVTVTTDFIYVQGGGTQIKIDGSAIGKFPITDYQVCYFPGSSTGFTTSISMNADVTSYGQWVGDYIEGTFSGIFVENSTTLKNVTGNFRIKRTE